MSPVFKKVANEIGGAAGDAVSDAMFASEKLTDRFRRWARVRFTDMPNWAIDRDDIVGRLTELLPQGHMTKLNAAALLCAVATNHKHSHFNTVDFLKNFLRLYNADTLDRVCAIEHIKPESKDWFELSFVEAKGGLEAVKIRCWAKDLEFSTHGNVLDRIRGKHKPITVQEVESLVNLYAPPAVNDNSKDEDPSAFPKNDYLPLLRNLREGGRISETQIGIILCFILHAKETRRDGSSYIAHPMAVANLTRKIAENFDFNDEDAWAATMAALLHDGGEKTTLRIKDDLSGLLPDKVIDAIDALHKRDGETYFGYLQRCCSNKLACLVKLADIAHNSSDMNDPSAKQVFVYPLAAAYVRYRLQNPENNISVVKFIEQEHICSSSEFGEIDAMAEGDNKKKKASEFPSLQSLKDKLISVAKIVTEALPQNAYARREEKAPLFA